MFCLQVLLRLEHIFQAGEHDLLSEPVSVDIQDLFNGMTIVGGEEMTLGGNMRLSQTSRLHWHTKKTVESGHSATHKMERREPIDFSASKIYVDLNPMEIRTFELTVTRRRLPSRDLSAPIFMLGLVFLCIGRTRALKQRILRFVKCV